MKILINTPPFNANGGVANHFLGLKNKFSFDVSFNFIGGNSGRKLLIVNQLKDYITFFVKLIKEKPDIVHLNPSLDKKATIRDGIFLLISKMLNKKVLVFWHGWKENFEKEIDTKYRNIFIKIFNNADGFCVLANEFENKLIEWGITKHIFLTTTKVDDILLKDFNIEKKDYNKIKILFLARIEKAKGIYEAIDTFELFPDRNIDSYIAGTGPDYENIKHIVTNMSNPKIHILGFVKGNDKIKLLKESNILLFPSYTEGMPTAVLEAMAFGLPIITRPVGGLKDFFEDGKMGYITESKDPEVFADLIEKLISDKEKMKEIGWYNHEYAMKHFLASKVAKRLEKVYIQLYEN